MKKIKNMKAVVGLSIIVILCCMIVYGVNVSDIVSRADIKENVEISVDSADVANSNKKDTNIDVYESNISDNTKQSDVHNITEESEVTDNIVDNNTIGKYTEEEIQQILDSLKGDGFKNNPLRQEYESKVSCLKQYGEALLKSGLSEKEVAQTLNQARRDLGVQYKDMTPQPLRDYIYEVNIERYGDKLGPTYEYLVTEKGVTDAKIIDSASRPNANIDKLLAGFEEWLRKQ